MVRRSSVLACLLAATLCVVSLNFALLSRRLLIHWEIESFLDRLDGAGVAGGGKSRRGGLSAGPGPPRLRSLAAAPSSNGTAASAPAKATAAAATTAEASKAATTKRSGGDAEGAVPLLLPHERPLVGSFVPPEAAVDPNGAPPKWITSPRGGNAAYKSTPYLPLGSAPPPVWAAEGGDAFVPLPGRAVRAETDRVCRALESAGRSKLSAMFRRCFPNTLETTVRMMRDGRAYVVTGDIDLMWLRDSSAQVHPYLLLPSPGSDGTVVRVVEGTILMQSFLLRYSPYGSAFRPAFRPNPPSDDGMTDFHTSKGRNVHVAMHNFELDSLLYPLWLAHGWWRATNRTDVFASRRWQESAWLTLDVMRREQRHFLDPSRPNDCADPPDGSCYRYLELGGSEHQGSNRVGYTGMVWSSHRPSDDQQKYGYLVPSNAFAVVVLGALADVATEVLGDRDMAAAATKLRAEVLAGIRDHGIVTDKRGNKVLAYEVDGLGNVNLMDDANVPSLLSLPYLGFGGPDVDGALGTDVSALLRNTRRSVVLRGESNPFYFRGKYADGVGSPHTPKGHVWHMAVSVRGLTVDALGPDPDPAPAAGRKKRKEEEEELCEVFRTLETTDAGTNFTHESFHVDDPRRFTRKWFAWSNSLFAEVVLRHLNWLTGGGSGRDPCSRRERGAVDGAEERGRGDEAKG